MPSVVIDQKPPQLDGIWARVIVGTNPDTGNWQVMMIPLDRVAVVPYDGKPPEGVGGYQ